jgi:hypothetical protein
VKKTSVSNKLGCNVALRTEEGGSCSRVNYRKRDTSAAVGYKAVEIMAYRRADACWLRNTDVGWANVAPCVKAEMA